MQIKKNYYAILTADVRYDPNITPNAKLLYAEITALCNEKGFCWAGNQYFADLYGKSKTTISKWVSQLKKQGYIDVKIVTKSNSREIDKRIITIKPNQFKDNTPLRKVNGGIEEKLNSPIEEKLIDNTTVINNTINNKKEKKLFLDKVKLTDEQYQNLIDKLGKIKTDDLIDSLNNYILTKGRDPYREHYNAILQWSKKSNNNSYNKKHNNPQLETPDWLKEKITIKEASAEEQARMKKMLSKWGNEETNKNEFDDFGEVEEK